MSDHEYTNYPPAQDDPEQAVERAERLSAKEFGDMAAKFATDTAYAAAGFAHLVAEKAREFADKQRAAAGDNPADQTKAFLDQVATQVNKFVEDLGHTYKDLAERGREAVAKMQSQSGGKEAKDAGGLFDIVDDADSAEPASTAGEAESDPGAPEVATDEGMPIAPDAPASEAETA